MREVGFRPFFPLAFDTDSRFFPFSGEECEKVEVEREERENSISTALEHKNLIEKVLPVIH